MVRSDYRPGHGHRDPEPPGLAPPDLDAPVRRARGRAGEAAGADAAGGGGGSARRAAGRRARARARAASCASSPPRPRPTAHWSSTAPATRSCGRPTGPSSRRSTASSRVTEPEELRAALGAGGGELTRLLPDLPARGRRAAASRSRPTPTPSATGSTPRSPTCSPTSAADGRCCWCSRTRTGPTPRRFSCCGTWRGRPARAAAAARHLPRHRGRRAGRPLGDARRPAPLRRRRPDAPRRALRRRGRRPRQPRGR